jgi:hypothetical protein
MKSTKSVKSRLSTFPFIPLFAGAPAYSMVHWPESFSAELFSDGGNLYEPLNR